MVDKLSSLDKILIAVIAESEARQKEIQEQHELQQLKRLQEKYKNYGNTTRTTD